MEIPQISAAAAGNSPSKAYHPHDFTLRVQAALGPKRLDGQGYEGRVLVAFSIASDGTLQGVRIAGSSGYNTLDSRALQIVGKASFPVPPPGFNVMRRSYISVFTFT